MEQERKIEKWLRAYAKKRRGQTGDSFKLDPATRRMLQNEVSRNAPPSEDEDDTMSLWEVLRQQWAFLLGFAVCIFLLASLFLPKIHPKSKAKLDQLVTAQTSVQNLRQIPGPALLDTNAQGPALDSAQIASRSERSSSDRPETRTFTANTAGQATNMNLAENAPTMAPPPELTPPAPGTPQSENAAPPAGIPPGSAGNFAEALHQTLNEVQKGSGSFAPAAEPSPAVQNNFLNTIPPPLPCSPVLRSFQVSQNGNTIRVVDLDGSVYTGTLQPEDYGANAAGTDKVAPGQQSFGGEADNNASPAAQSYSFRVGGTNRTLNQRVVFTATLLNELTLMKNAQVTFGMTANAAVGAAVAQQLVQSKGTNQVGQLPWSSLRIAGSAIINHTNQMQINALPIAPPTKTSNSPQN